MGASKTQYIEYLENMDSILADAQHAHKHIGALLNAAEMAQYRLSVIKATHDLGEDEKYVSEALIALYDAINGYRTKT